MRQILTLREENKNLTEQLADMSVQFAEADSEACTVSPLGYSTCCI
jgi:hypothetical protein